MQHPAIPSIALSKDTDQIDRFQFIQVLGSVTVPATPTSPPKRYTNVLTLNTAGSNLILFSCPSSPALISWASALRLSAWEKSRLEEIYTAHLIRITLSSEYLELGVQCQANGHMQIATTRLLWFAANLKGGRKFALQARLTGSGSGSRFARAPAKPNMAKFLPQHPATNHSWANPSACRHFSAERNLKG